MNKIYMYIILSTLLLTNLIFVRGDLILNIREQKSLSYYKKNKSRNTFNQILLINFLKYLNPILYYLYILNFLIILISALALFFLDGSFIFTFNLVMIFLLLSFTIIKIFSYKYGNKLKLLDLFQLIIQFGFIVLFVYHICSTGR